MNKCGIYINLLTAKRRRLFFKNTSFGNNFSGRGHSGSKWAVIGFSRLDFLYLRCYHLSAHTDCISLGYPALSRQTVLRRMQRFRAASALRSKQKSQRYIWIRLCRFHHLITHNISTYKSARTVFTHTE